MLFSTVSLLSCSKKSNDVNTSSTTTTSNPNTILTSGNFSISSFTQRTEDKTALFTGIVFTFANGGVVTADNKGTITTGKWSYKSASVSYYGSTPSSASVTINMGTDEPFSRLNKTWNIESGNTDASHLSLVNPEPQDNEHVKFTKQ